MATETARVQSPIHGNLNSAAAGAALLLTFPSGLVDIVAGIGSLLINLIFLIVLIIEVFKLLFECVERYIVIMICFYFAPLGL